MTVVIVRVAARKAFIAFDGIAQRICPAPLLFLFAFTLLPAHICVHDEAFRTRAFLFYVFPVFLRRWFVFYPTELTVSFPAITKSIMLSVPYLERRCLEVCCDGLLLLWTLWGHDRDKIPRETGHDDGSHMGHFSFGLACGRLSMLYVV